MLSEGWHDTSRPHIQQQQQQQTGGLAVGRGWVVLDGEGRSEVHGVRRRQLRDLQQQRKEEEEEHSKREPPTVSHPARQCSLPRSSTPAVDGRMDGWMVVLRPASYVPTCEYFPWRIRLMFLSSTEYGSRASSLIELDGQFQGFFR